MHERLHGEEPLGPAAVSTGQLPAAATIAALVAEARDRYAAVAEGTVADDIPALAKASADWFGISVCGVGGQVFSVGDAERAFSIQSISKPFVFALVCQAPGGGCGGVPDRRHARHLHRLAACAIIMVVFGFNNLNRWGLVVAHTRGPAVAQQSGLPPVVAGGLGQLATRRGIGGAGGAQAVPLIVAVEPRDHLPGAHRIADIDQPFDHAAIDAEGEVDLGLGLHGAGERDHLAAVPPWRRAPGGSRGRPAADRCRSRQAGRRRRRRPGSRGAEAVAAPSVPVSLGRAGCVDHGTCRAARGAASAKRWQRAPQWAAHPAAALTVPAATPRSPAPAGRGRTDST